jgi:tRNA (Thr-GGU) A37 N-methylase
MMIFTATAHAYLDSKCHQHSQTRLGVFAMRVPARAPMYVSIRTMEKISSDDDFHGNRSRPS